MRRHNRLGHIDEHAASCAFLLDPKERPHNNKEAAVRFLFDHAIPFLLHRRFDACTGYRIPNFVGEKEMDVMVPSGAWFRNVSSWPSKRLQEAKNVLTLTLQSQLNLCWGSNIMKRLQF